MALLSDLYRSCCLWSGELFFCVAHLFCSLFLVWDHQLCVLCGKRWKFSLFHSIFQKPSQGINRIGQLVSFLNRREQKIKRVDRNFLPLKDFAAGGSRHGSRNSSRRNSSCSSSGISSGISSGNSNGAKSSSSSSISVKNKSFVIAEVCEEVTDPPKSSVVDFETGISRKLHCFFLIYQPKDPDQSLLNDTVESICKMKIEPYDLELHIYSNTCGKWLNGSKMW